MVQYKPETVGMGTGVFGIVFIFLTTTLLVLVPQELMSPATSSAYIETWARPIMVIGEAVLVYGIPLASTALAYYLTTKHYSPKRVVTGFALGGLVFVVGDALLGVTVTHFLVDDPGIDRSLVGHLLRNAARGGQLVSGALLGALGATVCERFSESASGRPT